MRAAHTDKQSEQQRGKTLISREPRRKDDDDDGDKPGYGTDRFESKKGAKQARWSVRLAGRVRQVKALWYAD